jgi:cell division protein FtsN
VPAVLSSKKETSVPSKIATVLPLVKKTARLDPALKIENIQKSKSAESVTPEIKGQYRYVVQMGSFQDESRAGSLKSLLKKNGFDAFLTQTELADQAWHRVFLGRYVDEQKAQKAASLARSQFKLNAKVRKTH